jgi:hypothetical protein
MCSTIVLVRRAGVEHRTAHGVSARRAIEGVLRRGGRDAVRVQMRRNNVGHRVHEDWRVVERGRAREIRNA